MSVDLHVDVRPHHQCTTKKVVSILCVNEHGKFKNFFLGYGMYRQNTTIGIDHMIFFAPCGCECFTITLARA